LGKECAIRLTWQKKLNEQGAGPALLGWHAPALIFLALEQVNNTIIFWALF
jgi:hypothetical protein